MMTMLALLTLAELIILLGVAWRMANAQNAYLKPSREFPRPTLSTPKTPTPVLTKSQANTQALLRWQHYFDLLEETANGTQGSRRSEEGQGK